MPLSLTSFIPVGIINTNVLTIRDAALVLGLHWHQTPGGPVSIGVARPGESVRRWIRRGA